MKIQKPRAIVGTLRSDLATDPNVILGQLNSAFAEFKTRNEDRVSAIESALDEHLASVAVRGMSHGSQAADPEYSEAFGGYLRKGQNDTVLGDANAAGFRAQVQATMRVGTDSDGGYLAPTEWDRSLRKSMQDTSAMRRLATVMATGVGSFSTVWSNDVWGSGWVGEEAPRPETGSPTLSTLEFPSGEIYANVAATQRLLDDAEVNVEDWLMTEISEQFSREEGTAFLAGDGVNKPFGLLEYVSGGSADGRHPGGNLGIHAGGDAATVTPDGLVDFVYSLGARYRRNATWLMNSATAAVIAKLKTSDGDYLWRQGIAEGQPSTLLGYSVEIDEDMPDVGADPLPIAFGDFARGYLINDRFGIRTLRDPFTNKPFVHFYSTKRVGGGLVDPKAIRLLRIEA